MMAEAPKPNRRLRLGVLLAGLVIIGAMVALFAKSFEFDPAFIGSPLIGKPAPDFTLQDLDGRTYTLSDLRGQPVVLNFWASYCAPCVTEHPTLVQAARYYDGRAHFLGIIFQDSVDRIEAFQERYGPWGPSLLDPDGKVAVAYGIYGPPETFFIDKQGVIRKKVISAVNPRELKETVDAML